MIFMILKLLKQKVFKNKDFIELRDGEFCLEKLPCGNCFVTIWNSSVEEGSLIKFPSGIKGKILEMDRYLDPAEMGIAKVRLLK